MHNCSRGAVCGCECVSEWVCVRSLDCSVACAPVCACIPCAWVCVCVCRLARCVFVCVRPLARGMSEWMCVKWNQVARYVREYVWQIESKSADVPFNVRVLVGCVEQKLGARARNRIICLSHQHSSHRWFFNRQLRLNAIHILVSHIEDFPTEVTEEISAESSKLHNCELMKQFFFRCFFFLFFSIIY